MYILTSDRRALHNSDFIKRFLISEKGATTIIISVTDHNEPTKILGEYFSKSAAKRAFEELTQALIRKDDYFEMPEDISHIIQERKYDARTKRKGGS